MCVCCMWWPWPYTFCFGLRFIPNSIQYFWTSLAMLSFNEFSKVLSFSPPLGNNDNGANWIQCHFDTRSETLYGYFSLTVTNYKTMMNYLRWKCIVKSLLCSENQSAGYIQYLRIPNRLPNRIHKSNQHIST